MRRMQWAVLSLAGLLVLAGCSSPHHRHGMTEGGKGDAYWQKGQQDMAINIPSARMTTLRSPTTWV
ncbi:MAG: hypothetical protein ACM34B_17430 [Nitrospira sp.]